LPTRRREEQRLKAMGAQPSCSWQMRSLWKTARREQTGLSIDEVNVEADEYLKYLKMAYKEEKFPKPRTVLGTPKDLPAGEMEKLMLTHLEIRDEDLRVLAAQRSKVVRDYILRDQRVEAGRVFLVEPKDLEPEDREGMKKSRVDFKLR